MAFFPRFVQNEFSPMFRLLDEYANHVTTRSAWPQVSSGLRSWQPKFDIKENKDNYELHGELPGIEQKDLNIEFTDAQTLSIKGRTEHTRAEGTKPAALLGDNKQEQPAQITEGSEAKKQHQATVEDEATLDATANADAASTTNGSTTGVDTPATEATEAAATSNAAAPAEPQQPKSTYWLSERSVGEFSRVFSFSDRVDHENVKAGLKNGILSIVVPKAAAPEAKRITVE